MDHLNIFNPFKSKSTCHEDELTRTFLILLKNMPLAQACFIEMVREEMLQKGCTQVVPHMFSKDSGFESVETQVTDKGDVFKAANGRRLVSIIISDDKLYENTIIKKSNRNARYDGVILYQPNWIFVIENKPSAENIWLDQLNPNVSDDIEIEEQPVALSWRNVIEGLSSLIERNIVQGLEKVLVDDFLEFIDSEYPQLNPYTSFAVCENNEYLLKKRCVAIMERSALGKVEYHRGWKDYIACEMDSAKQIALSPLFFNNQWFIKLEAFPGDTMSQARILYCNINKEYLFKLIASDPEGWTLEPNMHFSFQASNLVWTHVSISIEDYIDYWIKNIENLRQIARSEFDTYFKQLEQIGLISNEDWDNINNKIINTNMQKINVCPGLGISYEWDINKAIELDRGTGFIDAFKQRFKEATAVWDNK